MTIGTLPQDHAVRDCATCSFLRTFTPRVDEPSGHGCTSRGWEGYVIDMTAPPCAGPNGPMKHWPK